MLFIKNNHRLASKWVSPWPAVVLQCCLNSFFQHRYHIDVMGCSVGILTNWSIDSTVTVKHVLILRILFLHKIGRRLRMIFKCFLTRSGQLTQETLPSSHFRSMVSCVICWASVYCHSLRLLLCTNAVRVFVPFWRLEMFLEQDREAFRMATVEPVSQLRDDLRFRLGEVQNYQHTAHPSNWEQVMQQVC